VTTIVYGGDIIPSELLSKFMKLHTNNGNRNILNGYGSTECGIVGMSKPLLCNEENANDLERIHNELTHIYKKPTVQHIVDEQTNELYVKSECLMVGYHDNPEKTKEVFTENGYFKTGDSVNVMEESEDGETLKFMVTARRKNVIVMDGGKYIFPQFMENVLLSHDKVDGAVIVGVAENVLFDDDNNTEYKYPVAFITVNESLNDKKQNEVIDELYSLCSKKIENGSFGVLPHKIFIVDSIPKNSVGKVNRIKLIDLATEYFVSLNKKHQQKLFH